MPQTQPAPPIILCFAATDPSGGAGLAADILAISAMGGYALPVVTAITVQDTLGVEDVHPLDAEWVANQARCVLEDMPVAAFKIGVMGSVEIVAAIAEVVSDYPDIPLILDPVLASEGGDALANEQVIIAMRELLLPQTTVLTPNVLEARRLASHDGDDEDPDLDECAGRLIGMGCEFVLITGTHESGPQVTNRLYGSEGLVQALHWDRLQGSYHGSGCTLAASLAAAMSTGAELQQASQDAQAFTWNTLAHAFRPGMGQFVPDRMFWAHDPEEPGDEDA
ncbi:MAG: hydroxymethylpyrimidine/phosphomethylpyrimidine kinase [Burkholderiales bacterium]|jgi:hydroxymethylpyrimidine/phosphomethylpyrimidine kinase|nr:hydroxymethylpyrimidine/phosphomethylpyrimidine kinase [Burkholderiales bacterium]